MLWLMIGCVLYAFTGLCLYAIFLHEWPPHRPDRDEIVVTCCAAALSVSCWLPVLVVAGAAYWLMSPTPTSADAGAPRLRLP